MTSLKTIRSTINLGFNPTYGVRVSSVEFVVE